jgi:hypothetical protein
MFQKIMPFLSGQEQLAASMSDQKRINSIAILRFINQ